jgi:hypothetical protein
MPGGWGLHNLPSVRVIIPSICQIGLGKSAAQEPSLKKIINIAVIMMHSSQVLQGFLCLLTLIPSTLQRSLQPLPLSRSEQWIIDADNNQVPLVGINWPGAADTMLPEGLGYQSIANIVQKISQTGFNVVRLTFAIEMVDDILDNGGDVTLNDTLTNALGQENGTVILGDILNNNPQFTANTTRLQVHSTSCIWDDLRS